MSGLRPFAARRALQAWNNVETPPASAMLSSSVSRPSTCRSLPSGPGTVKLEYWSTKHSASSANVSAVLLSHQPSMYRPF